MLEAGLRGEVLPTSIPTMDEVRGEFQRLLKSTTIRSLHAHVAGMGTDIPFETFRSYATGHRSPDEIGRATLLAALRRVPTPQPPEQSAINETARKEDERYVRRWLAIAELAAEIFQGKEGLQAAEDFEAMVRLLWLLDNPISWQFHCPELVGVEGVLNAANRYSIEINRRVRNPAPETAAEVARILGGS